ncbi:T9SS-dependent choice-of-anchor J family protein [Pontimicrobium aquaticum]|uniref:T9SS type A sorting domain-containing protein n=1 Tax=Pontimicrobium aquaticum TaxID=2565367 RepID=A0A4U0EVV0_9FLAO|nr:choice-of-anchor J domain-containing protein [Pontimicrobium aquaticum]TJY36076.1 T9SS type A sorting domain-containing protein [Pontimicrobium aquaticum]
MKKITLLVLLMWTSLFYGQEYLNEGFETSVPPSGWTDEAGSGDVGGYPWQQQDEYTNSGKTFTPLVGTYSAFYNELFNLTHAEDAGSPDAKDKWLISPSMDFTSASNPEIRFYETTRSGDFLTSNQFHVYYSTTHDGINFNEAQWVDLGNTPNSWATGPDDFVWKQRVEDLSAANGNSSVYIAFRYRGTIDIEWYIDEVLVRETPTCVEPSYGSISNIMSTSADFSWIKGPEGTETQWDVELVNLTTGETHDVDGTITSTSSNPYSFTSLTSGNTYAAYVRADCGGGDKSIWTGPFTFITQGTNDDCSGAEVIVQEVLGDPVNIVNGSISGASDSGIAENCFAGDPNDDVWYSFVARTESVNITVFTPFDGVVELFSTTDDTCGTLSALSIACADDVFGNDTEVLTRTGLTIGDTYFVRVYQYQTAPPTDGSFTIRIWSDQSLSVEDDNDLAEFKFYPNPVQDKLNLRAQDNIQKISVYNMLGQEVLRQAPNNNKAEVNMSALQTGSYFVKVTIDGVTETKQIIKR